VSERARAQAPRPRAIPVEPSFRAFVARTFGEAGRSWLDELPKITTKLAVRWQLELGAELPGGVLACVREARTAAGRRVVLKIGVPFVPARDEAAALQGWNGGAAPELLDSDEQAGALLLERIDPGTPAWDADASAVAAVLGRLHQAPVFPGLRGLAAEATDRVLRALEQGRTTAYMADWAVGKIGELEREPADAVLLHGDFDGRNLLRCARRGLAAIDPLPCVGDAAYDAGHWAHANGLPGRRARTTAISDALGLDVRRVRGWCAVAAIHG
jgi:streptomycin 6-kinase